MLLAGARIIAVGVCLGAFARAHKALAVAGLAVRRGGRVLVDAHAVARAVACGGHAAVEGAEAAKIDASRRGGIIGEAAERGGGSSHVDGARAWCHDDFGLGFGEDGLSAATERGRIWGCPVRVGCGAGGLGEEEEGGFEVGGGDVLPKEVEVIDEGLDCGVVLKERVSQYSAENGGERGIELCVRVSNRTLRQETRPSSYRRD